MTNKPEILFDEISRFITQSRALLNAGEMMELAGLDDQVRSLCGEVLQLSQEDRLTHGERLQELLGDLKLLSEEMALQRDQLANEIRGVPQFQKATVAYRTVNAIKGLDEKDDNED